MTDIPSVDLPPRRVLLDGGMGRELRHRGVEIPDTIWSANALLSAPHTVSQIHEDYITAGADVIITNTYGIIRAELAREGIEDRFAELNIQACKLAQEARAASGRQVRCGIRQSIPSSSIESCAGVTEIVPVFGDGQTKRPRSNRFENRQAPCPSHQMILIKSPWRPRNTNRWPENGSRDSTRSACAASEAKPLRISVTPAASQTFVLDGTGIKR